MKAQLRSVYHPALAADAKPESMRKLQIISERRLEGEVLDALDDLDEEVAKFLMKARRSIHASSTAWS